MTDPVSEFLVNHPTRAKWLDDIIDVFLHEPRGTAHVRTLARKLWQNEKRDIRTIEPTITRRINDFCSDAPDFNKSPAYDLFERVDKATWRLRSYPVKPDNIYELTTIHFDERAMQDMWEIFKKQNDPERWRAATNRRKLEVFEKWWSARQESYQRFRALRP